MKKRYRFLVTPIVGILTSCFFGLLMLGNSSFVDSLLIAPPLFFFGVLLGLLLGLGLATFGADIGSNRNTKFGESMCSLIGSIFGAVMGGVAALSALGISYILVTVVME